MKTIILCFNESNGDVRPFKNIAAIRRYYSDKGTDLKLRKLKEVQLKVGIPYMDSNYTFVRTEVIK